MFVVASKEAVLGFEKSDIRLLVLLAFVSVFERTGMALEGSEDSVVTGLGQRCIMARGAMKARTFLLSGLLLVGGEKGACTSRI